MENLVQLPGVVQNDPQYFAKSARIEIAELLHNLYYRYNCSDMLINRAIAILKGYYIDCYRVNKHSIGIRAYNGSMFCLTWSDNCWIIQRTLCSVLDNTQFEKCVFVGASEVNFKRKITQFRERGLL